MVAVRSTPRSLPSHRSSPVERQSPAARSRSPEEARREARPAEAPSAAPEPRSHRPDPRRARFARQAAAHDPMAQQLRMRAMNGLGAANAANAASATNAVGGPRAFGAPAQQTGPVTGPAAPTAQTESAEARIALEVRDQTQALSQGGAGAAELQSETLRHSIELYKQEFPDMPNHELMDRAMATTAMVLNGPGVIEHLEKIGGNQQVVDYMKALPAEAHAGGDLDSTNGGDLKPAFDDGTNNQAFHSNFFVTAGYINPESWLAKAGNLKHELLDPGATVADYKASHIGLETGATLRAARDAAESDPSRFELVASAPAVVGGMYANDPAARGSYSIAGQDYDFTNVAQIASDHATARIDSLDRHPATWVVGFFQGARDLLGLTN